jgi:hypothetical protein
MHRGGGRARFRQRQCEVTSMPVLVLRPEGATLAQTPMALCLRHSPRAVHAGTHASPRIRPLRRDKPDVGTHPPLRSRCNQSRTTAAAISASDVYLHGPDAAGVVQGDVFDDDDTAAADDDNDDEPR